ncbi:MAG: DUF4153 domain-containing protein [Mariprofundaceae bacterium]|nr:DUF4153 domain-containing protein [Mariprofundaceae bacterium]
MVVRYYSLIGLLQGCLLLLLHEAIVEKWAWMALPEFAFPAYAVVLLLPIIAMMAMRFSSQRQMMYLLVFMALVFVLLGYYSGSLAFEVITKDSFGAIFVFALSMLLLVYIGLPFVQRYLQHGHMREAYRDLYELGWMNTLILLLAGVFTGLVWIVLVLWGALFNLIEIRYFGELFSDHYFVYPATGLMLAYGISLGLRKINLDAVRKTDFFFRILTVLITFVSVLFLMALVVSGLEPLWKTRYATTLLLWLQIFTLLFVNALFQYGYQHRHEVSWVRWVRWSVSLSLLVMPVFSFICVYAVALRVGQYGWTEDRIWAAVIVLVMTMYAVGYAIAAVRGLLQKGHWLAWMAPTNMVVDLSILMIIILSNSPFFSPTHIAVQSQVSRLMDEAVSADKFDYNYLRFDAGRVGLAELKALSVLEGHVESENIQLLATKALRKKTRWGNLGAAEGMVLEDTKKSFDAYPENHVLDDALLNFLYEKRTEYPYSRCFQDSNCALVYADLNQDEREEVVLFFGYGNHYLLQKTKGKWSKIGSLRGGSGCCGAKNTLQKLKEHRFNVEDNPWQQLSIGQTTLQVQID